MLSLLSDLPASDRQALAILLVASVVCLRLADQQRPGRAWAVWSAALLAVTLPLADFVSTPNWQHVGLVPFSSPPIKPSDIAANIVLYLPIGWIATKRTMRMRRSQRVAMTMGSALVLSLSAEIAQLFSLYRYPSATDVVCNVAGAGLGAVLPVLGSGVLAACQAALRQRRAEVPEVGRLASEA